MAENHHFPSTACAPQDISATLRKQSLNLAAAAAGAHICQQKLLGVLGLLELPALKRPLGAGAACNHIAVPALTAEKPTADPLPQALGLLGQNGQVNWKPVCWYK